jgi:hypothetical protein
MHYVKFTADPRLGNGDFEAATYYLDSGEGVGLRVALRDGDTEITGDEYEAIKAEIADYNKDIPPPPEPEPPPDPFALIAEKLDEYADLLRSDNRKNESDKMHEVAEVARAASGR